MFIELVLVLILAIIGYFWVKNPFNYWKNKGIEQDSLRLVYNDTAAMFSKETSIVDLIQQVYDRSMKKDGSPNRRYVAGYHFTVPKLCICDVELIKELTVKNFDHFSDTNNFITSDDEVLWNSNLSALGGEKWRRMRTIMSPAFTTSKMRSLFVLIEKSAQQFAQHFLDKNEKTITIEGTDILTRYTNDVIANAVFGIECNSLKDTENEFYVNVKDFTDLSSFRKTVIIVILMMAPKFLVKLLKIRMFSEKLNNFFINIVKQNIANREKHGIVRPDLIHLLLQARKSELSRHEEDAQKIPDTGFATAQEADLGKAPISGSSISDEDITAQAVIFFFAGFDTVSTLMSFMIHELAVNPAIQNRLQAEIDAVANSLDDKKLTYEKLNTMKYLDMVVCEALRKWPSAIAIDRACTKDYTIQPKSPNEVALKIEKGTMLWVPIYAIHRDAQFYPDPEKFDPERFSDENKTKIQGGSYLPFGSGPRNCIGSRFALMETKALFYHILLNFNIVRVEKTQDPIKLNKMGIRLTAENGFWVGLERRN